MTVAQLCTATGCHLRGRHHPTCEDPDRCTGCLPRLAETGLVCDRCVALVRNDLIGDDTRDTWPGLVDTAPAAHDIAYGLTNHPGDGSSTGKPGSRMQLDTAAKAKLDSVLTVLTRIVDHIGTTRGITRPWYQPHGDEIAAAATWLHQTGSLEWIRHHADAATTFADLRACARIVRGIVTTAAAPKYLGPCGAPQIAIDPDVAAEQGIDPEAAARGLAPCDGDVYGRPGAQTGTCRTCKTEHNQAERRAWLDTQVRSADLAWTAAGIADALGINVKTIRTWANERRADNGTVLRHAKLSTFWRDTDGHLVPWVEPRPGEDVKARGDRLHYVADVKALAEEAAERRAGRQQRAERMGA